MATRIAALMKAQEEKDNTLRGEKRDMANQLKAMNAKATDRKRRLIQAESKVVDYHRRLANSAAARTSDQSELESLYLSTDSDEREADQQIRKPRRKASRGAANTPSGDTEAPGSSRVDSRQSRASKYDRKLARGKPDKSSKYKSPPQ
ncbi:hypothetical protein N7488_006717 [Penicillium malachiteum]|nr:hypothetical protein N7488_006717 [Penicillium malachiteum]